MRVRVDGLDSIVVDHPEANRADFELTVDTSGWEQGRRQLEVLATDRRGAKSALTRTVDLLPFQAPPLGEEAVLTAITAGDAAMWYEAPDLQGGQLSERYPEVRGWAIAAEGIERVLVTIDDRLRIRAAHGLTRPDLRGWVGDEVAVDCGFALRLDPRELPVGEHRITIVAVTRGGSALGVDGAVERLEDTASHDLAVEEKSEGETPTRSQRRFGSGERFLPDQHSGRLIETEHRVRYWWAASLVDGLEVLDAGCGVGWGTALLAERAARAIGVDLAPQALTEARREHGARTEFQEGDLLDLPFDDGAFDAVICFEAIEHVADPERALDELQRVLRPNGVLIVSTPNRGVYPPGNPFHIHEFTSEEFRRALRARFANVAIHHQQSYDATLLGDERDLRLDEPAVELQAKVVKLVGGEPGSELYAVAAASDADLPPPPHNVVLGGRLEHEEAREQLDVWQERAVKAEIEAAIARTEAYVAAQMQRRAAEKIIAREDEAMQRVAELEAELAALKAASRSAGRHR